MTEIRIERLDKYSIEDAAGIGRLMPQLSDKFDSQPIPEAQLSEIINSKYHEQLVAKLQNRIVGAATLSIILGSGAGRKGWLEDFVTDQNSGVRGVGKELWQEMQRWFHEQEVPYFEFTSRAGRGNAHRFYLREGAVIRETSAFRKDI